MKPLHETPHTIAGIAGRLTRFKNPGVRAAGCFDHQTWISEPRPIGGYGAGGKITVEIRHDDQCKNGHNSFAITATVRTTESMRERDIAAGGCLHDDIAKVFPELAHLIKWHLSDTRGPMHYIENTLYLAGDRDCHGLFKGENRQIKNGRTGALCWELVAVNSLGVGISSTPTGDEYRHSDTVPLFILDKNCQGDTPPLATPVLKWAPSYRIGEGKARQLEAARRVAVWPDATDAQLCLPRDDLKALLEARLPELLDAFRADVESIGFQFVAVGDEVTA